MSSFLSATVSGPINAVSAIAGSIFGSATENGDRSESSDPTITAVVACIAQYAPDDSPARSAGTPQELSSWLTPVATSVVPSTDTATAYAWVLYRLAHPPGRRGAGLWADLPEFAEDYVQLAGDTSITSAAITLEDRQGSPSTVPRALTQLDPDTDYTVYLPAAAVVMAGLADRSVISLSADDRALLSMAATAHCPALSTSLRASPTTSIPPSSSSQEGVPQ